jgi:hypothetical protein
MVEDAPAPLPDMGLGKLTTLMQMGQPSYLIVKPCASHAMKEIVRMGANSAIFSSHSALTLMTT